jgi:hypothetical protein
MNDAENCNTYINIKSPQTYRSQLIMYFSVAHYNCQFLDDINLFQTSHGT